MKHHSTCQFLLPQQENSFDCGLFLLHYVERFLEESPAHFNPLKLSKFSNFKKESVDGKVTRTRVFLAIHTTKDGLYSQVDEIRKLVSIDPYLGEKDLDNDPVALVCGRDWKGRVRALGSGISKTTLNASAPYRESAEREKRKNENLDAKLKVCMQRIDEETRARMLVEERVASLINCSTDSGNASQGRRPSLSTSSGSSIPSSTRCLIKNFKKKICCTWKCLC